MIGKEFGSRSEAAVKPLIQKRIGTPEATDAAARLIKANG
jgi:hypothetical protein